MNKDFLSNSISAKWLKDIFSGKQIFLIAGPCVIESEKTCLEYAAILKEICQSLDIAFIFKTSFDKANRTSLKSYRGPGLKKGLLILARIKKKLNIPLISDVHQVNEVNPASQVLDVIQIPALLCRQTDLILAAAKTRKIINVKKGQFMAAWDMKNVVNKIEAVGNRKIMITERGSCFGYNNLICDMRAFSIMKKFGYPVVFDATHSVQLPGAGKDCSGGQREFVSTLALSAVAAGCDGLFLEVHKNPDKALCDGPNMLNFRMLQKILIKAKKIHKICHD